MYESKMQPRNGHTFHIGIVARISGCQRQKELSLEDQIDHAKEEARSLYDEGVPVYHVISTKGKGERTDRPELEELEQLIRSKVLDLLVVEDLGRIVRGTEAERLCGIAVDHGVRVYVPHDCIDTAEPAWQEEVISACRDHVGHNAHTSKRLKQKMLNRFQKNGACMARPIYGYIVTKEAKTYGDWLKDEAATPVIQELFRRYREIPNFSLLADWLNVTGVSTGPYDRTKKWDSAKVRRLMANPLLKGQAWRGNRHTVKHHETGRRISVRNPKGPVYYSCPHLAHVREDLWEEVNELRKMRNQGLGRKPANGSDPLAGVSRTRTIFPGQHARCGICGRLFVWGGHGKNEHMMCAGVHDYLCWNAMTFDGHLASKRIVSALLNKLEELPEFDLVMLEKLNKELDATRESQSAECKMAERELTGIDQKIANLSDAIADTGLDEILGAKLRELKMQRLHLLQKIASFKETPQQEATLPPLATLKQRLHDALQTLAAESVEFGHLMNTIIRDLRIFPFRICDGNRIVQRGTFTINLVPLLKSGKVPAVIEDILRHEVTIDLFDPPQRVQFREQIMSFTQNDLTLAQAAQRLGITKVAAQNAIRLNRIMEEKGLTDPFEPLAEPPFGDTKIKRHLHPRYRFTPLVPVA